VTFGAHYHVILGHRIFAANMVATSPRSTEASRKIHSRSERLRFGSCRAEGAQQMNRHLAAVVMIALSGAAASAAQVALQDLPPAVRATVERETKNAVLKGVSKEKEHGKVVYELESLVDGRTRDLMIDSAGKVYVVEEQVDPAKLPDAVRAAFEAKGTITKAETVRANGKTTYEGQMKSKGGKTTTLEVDEQGRAVKH
jgi:uncharacterized membrane protein YkoI